WGDGCGRPNKYGVYTKVSFYVDWIQSTINKPVKLSSLNGQLSSYGQTSNPDTVPETPAESSYSDSEGLQGDVYASENIDAVLEVLGSTDMPMVVATYVPGVNESAAISDLSSEEESAILEEFFGNGTSGDRDMTSDDLESPDTEETEAPPNSNGELADQVGTDRDELTGQDTEDVLSSDEDRNVIAIGVIERPDWCGDGCLISKSSVPDVVSPGIYPLTSLGVKTNHTAYVGFTGPLGTGLILSRQPGMMK
ncbi:hypothetical protein SARC_13528, partial [Sphaeroforma arctica JP610]